MKNEQSFMIKIKYILPFVIFMSLAATNASAAVCSPTVQSSIKQAQYNVMKTDATQLETVAEDFMSNINNSLETIGCTDVWPTGNLGINLPSIDSIIKKTKEAAISKACSLAREKMRDVMGNISESISIDMPVIGNVGGVSVSTGTGSSAGGTVNVNGDSTDVWNSISSVMK
ncbi:hypothetical protein [Pectobacterium quasiaquaticum]|uniref:hypothetical protein n=1 Tax=Pectobacterium quasiaquaticum TaxID=2774015 RepID=UPI001CF77C20|nr:hypothetical protein [Pectobacterium quasiaquaticum]